MSLMEEVNVILNDSSLNIRHGFKMIITGEVEAPLLVENDKRAVKLWKCFWREIQACRYNEEGLIEDLLKTQPHFRREEVIPLRNSIRKDRAFTRPSRKMYKDLFPTLVSPDLAKPLIINSDEEKDKWNLAFKENWAERHTDYYLYNHNLKIYMQYEKGIYKEIPKIVLRAVIVDFYQEFFGFERTAPRTKQCFEIVEENHGFFMNDFDKDRNILNVKNGLLNLTTLEIEDHNMNYKSVRQLPINFHNPPRPTPTFDGFRSHYFEEFFKIERYVQSILHRDFTHKQMLNLLGQSNSGKSTILNIIHAVFDPVTVVGDISGFGESFPLGLFLYSLLFLDKDVLVDDWTAKTIKLLKSITAGDWAKGTTVNIKGVKKFMASIQFFVITAGNQFGRLPRGMKHANWFSRVNIAVLDKTFPNNPTFADDLMGEIDDWVSELLLTPYHNWTVGVNLVKEWAPKQKTIWERSALVFRNIAEEFFEYKEKHSITVAHVVALFTRVLEVRDITSPSEKYLTELITKEFARMKGVKEGRGKNQIYMNIYPISMTVIEQILGVDLVGIKQKTDE